MVKNPVAKALSKKVAYLIGHRAGGEQSERHAGGYRGRAGGGRDSLPAGWCPATAAVKACQDCDRAGGR